MIYHRIQRSRSCTKPRATSRNMMCAQKFLLFTTRYLPSHPTSPFFSMTDTQQQPQQQPVPLQDQVQELLTEIMPNKIAKMLGHALKPSSSSSSSKSRSVPESQAQPLAGASLYILDYDDLLVSEQQQQQHNAISDPEVVQVIQALGGRVVDDLDSATHALVVQEHIAVDYLSTRLEHGLVAAQAMSIPIVQATPWLQRCAGLTLAPNGTAGDIEHWSAVPVLDIVPPVVQCYNERQEQAVQQHHKPKRHHHHARRDSQDSLSQSLTQTFHSLTREDPDLMERDALRRAMELSLLDCAIVVRDTNMDGLTTTKGTTSATTTTPGTKSQKEPHQVLGVPANATPTQIKAAYRKLAKETHPDRGGSQEDFHQVAMAYRSLLTQQSFDSIEQSDSRDSCGSTSFRNNKNEQKHLKSTAHWDNELADHRRLVEELFAGHGADISQNVATLTHVLLELLHLEARNAGSINVNEQQQVIHNSCFYLSLAASYLSGIGALDADVDPTVMAYTNENNGIASMFGEEERYLIGETALQLKRLIEAAVVSAHPEWAASGMVGEEVQGFSDFLVYLLDSPATRISHWAIVVFDTTSGVCDVFKGKFYDDEDAQQQRVNCITLKYTPGHYEPLLPMRDQARRTLSEILKVLDDNNVFYVITDGAA